MARAVKKEKNLTPEEKLAQALVPDVEQTFRIPSNWKWCYLDSFANIRTGKKDANYGSKGGKYYFFTCATEPIRCDDYSFDGKFIILAGNGDIGNISIYNGQFEAYQRTYVLGVNEHISAEYVYYYFKYRWVDYNEDKVFGTAIPYIRLGNLQFFPIPLPPINEQQRIVDRIESLFAKLDDAKEKAQTVVDGFEDRKAAILHKAFTGELTKNWRHSNGNDASEWKHKKITEICDIVRGGSPRPAGDPQYYDGDIPFMKVADITKISGPYVKSTEYSIKEAGLKKTRMVDANTLLLTNSGATLGVPAICTFQTTFNDGIAAFLNLDPRSLLFFYYFWTSKTQELRAINMGAAQPNLNTAIIGAIEVDLPSIEEQQEIVKILERVLNKEAQITKDAEQVIDQIDSMKKSILARAFRGEMGTNDPNDESAVELLKRILTEGV